MYFIVAFQFAAGSSWFFNLSNSDRFRPLLDSAEFEGKRAHPFGKVAAGYRLQVTGYRLQVTDYGWEDRPVLGASDMARQRFGVRRCAPLLETRRALWRLPL